MKFDALKRAIMTVWLPQRLPAYSAQTREAASASPTLTGCHVDIRAGIGADAGATRSKPHGAPQLGSRPLQNLWICGNLCSRCPLSYCSV